LLALLAVFEFERLGVIPIPGIVCNAVAPGKIVTGFDSDNRAYSLSRTPAPRLGCPEDVAETVVYLASDCCSSYIRGINLLCDGGWIAS
jgi:NAD(P)-dependent dehydrogenase (short-subunit alcohol dehydrogenase family)